ncbi:MAG: flippase [Chloroflexi bacterium]|nr:flippase [Chloroflexota bacterium]
MTAAKGGGITFIGALFGYAGRFALGFVLARSMGDEQYGLYSLADSAVYLLIGALPLGLSTAILHFVPIFKSWRDETALWKTLQIGLMIPCLTGLMAGIGLFVFAEFFAKTVFHEPQLALPLRIAAFAVPAGTLAAVAVATTQSFKQMQYKVITQDILLTLLKLILFLLLAITGLNAIKAMTAYSVAMIVSCIVLLYFLNRLLPAKRSLHLDIRHMRKMFKFSLPVYMAELLTIFGPNLRTLLLGSLNTIRSVGVFTVASRVSMVGSAFFKSIAVMSMPIVSELYANKEQKKLAHFFHTMSKWTFTVNLPFFLIIILFSRPILSIFGESFIAGSTSLIILACNSLVTAATGICGVMVIMTENTWLNTMNSALRLILTLVLSVWLIPEGGMIGAAIATSGSLMTVNLILTIEVLVLFRLLPYHKGYIKPLIAGGAAVTVAYALLHYVLPEGTLVGTIVGIGTLVGTYVGVILLLGLSPEDRLVLNRLFDRLSHIPLLTELAKRLTKR